MGIHVVYTFSPFFVLYHKVLSYSRISIVRGFWKYSTTAESLGTLSFTPRGNICSGLKKKCRLYDVTVQYIFSDYASVRYTSPDTK